MVDKARYVQTTHEVTNQSYPFEDYDAYVLDRPLAEAVTREAGDWLTDKLTAYGRVVGSAEMIALGASANEFPPKLRTHDRYGHRVDEVDYHPAYHELMKRAMAHEVHSAAYRVERKGGQVAHAALLYLHSQADGGTACPLTMTHASVASLRVEPRLADEWLPRVLSNGYDPRCIPAAQKASATIGMAMTEKQGGSDVRANTTRARPMAGRGSGEAYELTGHKWFCSAPMSDAFLTLAQTDRGLSCFLVPRFLPDGSRNRLFLQRLKDKLGNRSNASSEVEYDRTFGQLVGDEGRGVHTIIQMVAQTRVDCAVGSAALMRRALVEAIHHTRQRSAFGRRLSEQPLMKRVLADLTLETEAAVALAFRVAGSSEAHDEQERLFARVGTAIAKYWITRRAPGFAFEAMECLGGAGYVEESGLPRLFRESPLNSIWEGSGNVQCLDVLRAMRKEVGVMDALFIELGRAAGASRTLDLYVTELRDKLSRTEDVEDVARKLVEEMALALSAALLLRHAPAFVSEPFIATRLGRERGLEYGSFAGPIDAHALLERAAQHPSSMRVQGRTAAQK